MKALPRALAPWSEELAAFSDEGRALFGSWLPALDRLLGPHAEELDITGDPDGFSGLGRRGRYERLALSQWGVLDFAPDEFLRRAGSSEHLFHQIARSSRSGGRRVVVLFDAGPAQLGAPRLVHLAWLLVVGRRARRRSIRLDWGILQASSTLREGADVPAVRALLAARSAQPVTLSHVTAWREWLGPPIEAEERWVVGASGVAAQLSAAALVITEPDDPSDRLLRVEVTPRRGPRVWTRLALRESTSRLLVDPFPREARAGSAYDEIIATGAQVVFSGGGNHLIARLHSGGLVAFAIPVRPDARFLPLVRFPAPTIDRVVAAGWAKGTMYVATVTEERRVALHISQGRRWRTTVLGLQPDLPPPRPSSTALGALTVDRRSGRVRFQDAGGRVYQAHIEGGGRLSTLPETALAFVSVQACLVTLGRVGDGPLETFQHRRDRLDRRNVAFDDISQAIEGFLCVHGDGRPSLAAVSVGGSVWWVKNLATGDTAAFRLVGGAAVFGTELSGKNACLLLRRQENELELATPVRSYESFRFPGPVEHACLQPGGGHLLAAQVNAGLVVLHRRGLILGCWGGYR
jgi:hypothetical protein